MKSQFIHDILTGLRIEEYLRSKGHDPAKVVSGRLVYSCPLHGPERDPSFNVYLNGEYDSFYCFGCKKGGDVVNLHAYLSGLENREAFIEIARTLNLDFMNLPHDELEMLKFHEDSSTTDIEDFMKISSMGRVHIETVNGDPEEFRRVESMYKKIDEHVSIHGLDNISMLIPRIQKILGESEKRYKINTGVVAHTDI